MPVDVNDLTYVILLCDDLAQMKAFYQALFAFPVLTESATDVAFRTTTVAFTLRQRTRVYDGQGVRRELPGVQIAFRVTREEVDLCYSELLAKGVTVVDPPTDQPRGHRTVYFTDPEGNLLEIYADIPPAR